MSLFGGESAPTTTDGSSDSESLESLNNDRLSPPTVDAAEAQSAQNAAIVIDSDDSNELYSVSGEEEESDEDEFARPNRFRGPPQTWKGYTAADRQIAASLDQIQNTDLAAHLYNAHALKRRVRRPTEELGKLKNWQSRNNWLKTGAELESTDAAGLQQTDLVPSRDWTAWPLPPESHIPLYGRAAVRTAIGAPDEWSIGDGNTTDAGSEMREEMLAVFLRIAKENWNLRETDAETELGPRSRSRSRGVRPIKSQRSVSRGDTEMKDGDDGEQEGNDRPVNDAAENEFSGKKRGRKLQNEVLAEPTLLADDARAYRLLQPSINSLLGRFDELALAIQRTRLNHFRNGGSEETSSQSDYTTAAESEPESTTSSRPASKRPRSRNQQSKASSRTTSPRVSSTAARGASGRSHAGTDHDSVLGDTSDTDISAQPHPRKRARSASTTSAGSRSMVRDRARAGLIDWSDILGLAAVKGWDERVLARTAQRCANLFGESMSFTTFDADAAPQSLPEPVQYTPSTIPPPGIPSILGAPSSKRPLFQPGTLRCPHKDCYGYDKDFALPYRVVEHCIRVHEYDPRTNDDSNETRTLGGVQIDGFLQPVTLKPGWLGHGRTKAGQLSKKLKRERSANSAHAETIDARED